MSFIKMCSTDGELLVDKDSIDYVLFDPTIESNSTSLVTLKSGKTFEVSGRLDDIEKKLQWHP